MPKVSTIMLAAVIATSTGAAMAGDLTPADYQFLKSKMNTTKEQVEKDINPKLWARLHELINSNATLEDKKKFYAAILASSACYDLRDQGVLPADMKCGGE